MNNNPTARRCAVILAVFLVIIINISIVLPGMTVLAANAELVIISRDTSLYAESGLSSSVLLSLKTDSTYPYISEAIGEDGAIWYEICYDNGCTSWVSSADSAKVATSPALVYSDVSTFNRLVTPTGQIVLRSGAGNSYAAVVTVSSNQTFTVLDDGDGTDGISWFKVLCGRKTGWISRKSVKIINAYTPVGDRSFSQSDPPVIYLSPSNQTGNPYSYGGTNECVQMTRVATRLKEVLEEKYNCIVYVAEKSLSITKNGRPLEAYNLGADIYIAIHSNAFSGSSRGAQSYYYAGNAQSQQLGVNLAAEMEAVTTWSSNVASLINGMSYLSNYGYGEVRNPGALGMVSILFETEYHDNATTAKWIVDNTEAIAQAMALGIDKTFSLPLLGVRETQAAELLGVEPEEFIEAIAPTCADDMNTSGVIASLSIARAVLESQCGQSDVAQMANNIYHLPADPDGSTWQSAWNGEVYSTASAAQTTATLGQTNAQLTTASAEPTDDVVTANTTASSQAQSGGEADDEAAGSGNDSAHTTATAASTTTTAETHSTAEASDTTTTTTTTTAATTATTTAVSENAVGDAMTDGVQYRKYPCIERSISDQNAYLSRATLNGELVFAGLAFEKDYTRAARILADGLFDDATESEAYAASLCDLIEEYDLTRYDVWNVPSTGISISSENLSLTLGNYERLSAVITPSYSSDTVIWSSSNQKIVTVDESGLVRAVGNGTALVVASAGSNTVTCMVKVDPGISIELLGANIRLLEPYGLRFGFQLKKDSALSGTNVVEFGTLIIPESKLNGAELTLNTASVQRIPADKIYSEDAKYRVFTGVITNIPSSGIDTSLTGRGYLIYKDVNGSECVVYSESKSISFREAAQRAFNSYIGRPLLSDAQQDTLDQLRAILGIDQ